jgi:hypothetical protein
MKLKFVILFCFSTMVLLGTTSSINACASLACKSEAEVIPEQDIPADNCCSEETDQAMKKGCGNDCDNECGDDCSCNCCAGVSVATGYIVEFSLQEPTAFHAYLSPYTTSYSYDYFGAIWQPPRV